MKKYYQESVKAEEKCNSSVYGADSPVGQSKETRTLTEDLLDAREEKFFRALAAQNKSLNQLQQQAHSLDNEVQRLSHKVSIHSCVRVTATLRPYVHIPLMWNLVNFPLSVLLSF